MANHLPGRAHLSSDELMVAELKKTKTHRRLFACFLHPNKFYQNTLRLHKKKECKLFFSIANKPRFRSKMKRRITFSLKNLDSDYETPLDVFELQKLNRLYKRGERCGELKQKFLLRNYIWKQTKFRNGHKFKMRVFLVVLSAKPLLVAFHRGYTILDRFNNSISFTDASIAHEDLFAFLKAEHGISKTRFNIIFDEIKQASSLLLELSHRKFLRDPRYFQVFAADFVLDANMTPWLVDVKGAPDYTLRNERFVSDLLALVHDINQERAQRLMDLINRTRHEVNRSVQEGKLKAKYWSEFFPGLRRIVALKMKGLAKTMRNKLPSKARLREAELEVLYNETRPGKAKGQIPEYCL